MSSTNIGRLFHLRSIMLPQYAEFEYKWSPHINVHEYQRRMKEWKTEEQEIEPEPFIKSIDDYWKTLRGEEIKNNSTPYIFLFDKLNNCKERL